MRDFIVFDLGETLVDFNLERRWRLSLWGEVIPQMYKTMLRYNGNASLKSIPREEFAITMFNAINVRDRRLRTRGMDKRIADALNILGVGENDGLISALIDTFGGVLKEYAELYPDVITTLSTLKKQNYKIGLFSDTPWQSPGKVIENILDDLGIRKYFDITLFSGDIERRKPDPGVFRVLLDVAGIKKERMVYVGDRRKDIVVSKRFGIPVIWINRPDELKNRKWKNQLRNEKELLFNKIKGEIDYSSPFSPEYTSEEKHLQPDYSIKTLSEILEILPID